MGVDLDIMVIVDLDIMDMVDMDLAIGEEREDLLKQSLLLKQIQRLKLILIICIVGIMVDLDIMDMVGMVDTLMDMENKAAQQLIIKNNIVTIQITCIQCSTDFYNDDLCNLNGHAFAPQSLNTVSVQNMTWQSSPYYDKNISEFETECSFTVNKCPAIS